MPTETITERRDDQELPGGRITVPEMAPSIMREDEPRVARLAGMWGLMFLVLGVAALMLTMAKVPNVLGYFWGTLCAEVGIILMLFHAASDRDEQLRRGYAAFGGLFILAGAVLTWVRYRAEWGGLFPIGFTCLCLGLFFETAFLRNETDEQWRDVTTRALGAIGGILALAGIVLSFFMPEFLTYRGFFLAVIGLAYLCAFLAVRGTEEPLSYRLGQGMGLLGLLTVLVALGRSVLPGWFYAWGWLHDEPLRYFVPYGALQLALGAAYLGAFYLLCSDRALATITRRELGAFFYSPIFYIVLLGVTVIAWLSFFVLVSISVASDPMQTSMVFEPVIYRLFFTVYFYLFAIVFLVPALTMRLFSEEKRSGTLEVLLTAPVSETTVVLGKFLAGLLFFLLTWLPWVFFIVALHVAAMSSRGAGGETHDFDVYPFISSLIAWVFIGSAFIAMGLFFSSLTENQIISFMLTAAGMLAFVGIYVLHILLNRNSPNNFWVPVLHHVNFLDLWETSLKGSLTPRYLIAYFSMAIFWLFLSVKVLEARKWK